LIISIGDFIEIVKNLDHLPLRWLHRARNRLYLGENKYEGWTDERINPIYLFKSV